MSRDRYFDELEQTRADFLRMGDLAVGALDDALHALTDSDAAAAGRARSREPEIDALNRTLYDACLRLMTLQQPVAGDARLLTGILGAIVDLELIGDYADDIAELVQEMTKKPATGVLAEFSALGHKVQDMLKPAVARWRMPEQNGEELALRPLQAVVKKACHDLLAKLAQLRSIPQENSVQVGLILICKYLERIASHSVSLAEQAALVAGTA